MKITANRVITGYIIGSSVAILALVAGVIYEGVLLHQIYEVAVSADSNASQAAASASDANDNASTAADNASSAESSAQEASDEARNICLSISTCY